MTYSFVFVFFIAIITTKDELFLSQFNGKIIRKCVFKRNILIVTIYDFIVSLMTQTSLTYRQ